MAVASDTPIPSLKDLASSDPRLRRLAFEQIFAHLSERTAPLTPTQCLQLWRGFFVALYMHDSKSMISVQNLITSLGDQFTVIAAKDITRPGDDRMSQLGVFSEAFWETMAREWSGIDVHRMNKILLLIRVTTRSTFKICMPSATEGQEHDASPEATEEQCAILEKWPLSPRERKVPDGLRYHVLDVWVDELEKAGEQTGVGAQKEGRVITNKFLEPVTKLAKDGLTKTVRTRAKETLVQAKEMFNDSNTEVHDT